MNLDNCLKIEPSEYPGKDCVRCSVCYGTGLLKEDNNLIECHECDGHQCYIIGSNFAPTECDRSCGFEQEEIREDYLALNNIDEDIN